MQDKKHYSSQIFRAGFVAIVGRPSVGKSTLINKVCGEHTVITSPFPQTTRSVVRGIVTKPQFQIVFLDTPGMHEAGTIYGKHLTKQALYALKDSDVILYVLDATRTPGKEEEVIITTLENYSVPIIVAINKMDAAHPPAVNAHLQLLRNRLGGVVEKCHFISAQKDIHIEKMIQDIASSIPEHNAYYPEGYYTDQTPDFRICEQIRSVTLEFVREEIPHAFFVEIIGSEVSHTNEQGEPTHIFVRAQLVVEQPSQQGILIGKGGSMIKKIRILSTKRLKELFDYKIELELRVTVNKKWKKDLGILDHL